MSDATAPQPLMVFVSSAHQDDADRKRLDVHLKPLVNAGLCEVWHDRALRAGQDWAQEIEQRIAEADVVVLLVSADLISSDCVNGVELEQAMRQEAQGRTHIVSVILGPCRWQAPDCPLASRQALPPRLDQVKSVQEHPQGPEKAFDEVRAGLEELFHAMRAQRSAAGPPAAAHGIARAAMLPAASRGRRGWAAAAFGALALLGLALFVHGRLQHEAAEAWRLLRIGEYADAHARFGPARWWPGLDGHGAGAARLGLLLAQLGDEKVRREFDAGLLRLAQAAPNLGMTAYLAGVARFDDWRLAPDAPSATGHFEQMQAHYRAAAARDPALAEAFAGLALAANVQCRLDDALHAIDQAQHAAGQPARIRYAVQRAEVLSRYGDDERRAAAMQIFETRSQDPRARLLQAMLAWQAGQWAQARDKIADALAAGCPAPPRPAMT